ncbi:hypothetical protein Nepgr_018767 [Nepenthes gracilis]|uniref:Transmembrane protein n=1 Tax=Nepenthes gracilis TaxID=150966 RepID=A0AAD3SVT9_NEPGR|nr:hypothetical protein Nepgr_018767 [Nepenthes gracilis]
MGAPPIALPNRSGPESHTDSECTPNSIRRITKKYGLDSVKHVESEFSSAEISAGRAEIFFCQALVCCFLVLGATAVIVYSGPESADCLAFGWLLLVVVLFIEKAVWVLWHDGYTSDAGIRMPHCFLPLGDGVDACSASTLGGLFHRVAVSFQHAYDSALPRPLLL